MNEFEKLMEKIAKEEEREEQAKNRKKALKKQASELKRKANTKRKIEKGGMFESFEREITGKQDETNAEVLAEFLRFVFYKDYYKDKLKEITENHLKAAEITEQDTLDNEY